MDSARKKNILLRLLARSYGIATSYIDYRNKRVVIPQDVLCRFIKSVSGEDINKDTPLADLTRLYENIRQDQITRIIPTTLVIWDGMFPKFWMWLAENDKSVQCELHPEHGENITVQELEIEKYAIFRTINGKTYMRTRLKWTSPVPYGYYTLRIRTEDGRAGESMLISAPAQMAELPKCWGVFAPVYALRGETMQGTGTYGDLLQAARMIKNYGGEFLGTLPLLPLKYEGERPEYSPYSPLSRLFWNELFLDVTALPGPYEPDVGTPEALQGDVIDYEACYAFKKPVLIAAVRAFFETYPEGDEAFRHYVDHTPHLKEYADFCARKHPASDYDMMVKFHLYTQYACHVQLSRIREEGETGKAAALYLDYTVGVHPDGFDAQKLSESFLKNYQVGAPPDLLFNQGQAWGFEPLHPRKLEESRYQYLRDCFHHYFQHAKMVRIDHVMGLYRLYCVPEGLGAKQGTYIYYNLNAQLGVLCLEAWRHHATVIGEDLGTVPERIKEAMDRHRLGRMWIGQFNIKANLKRSFSGIRPTMIAALNTHDMFPFAAYIEGTDLREMNRMGFLDKKEMSRLLKERMRRLDGLNNTPAPYLAAIEEMARSKAKMVMINMEDLWGETNPQNMPGTTTQHPNWRHKFARRVQDWPSEPLFCETVEILNRHRMVRP